MKIKRFIMRNIHTLCFLAFFATCAVAACVYAAWYTSTHHHYDTTMYEDDKIRVERCACGAERYIVKPDTTTRYEP